MNVLVGSDGSADARAGSRLLTRWPFAVPLDITVLAVIAPIGPRLPEGKGSPVERAEAVIGHDVHTLAAAGCDARGEYRTGDPGPTIIARARELQAGLVVVGRRGASRLQRVLLGSVADHVVRRAPGLALVGIDGANRLRPRRLLVATDGSPAADSTIGTLLAWGPIDTLSVMVVVAVEPHEGMPFGAHAEAHRRLLAAESQARRKRVTEAQGIATGTAERFRQRGLKTETVIVEQPPADAILAVAAERGADLIALGTRGRSALAGVLLGSVARIVLQQANAPLLIGRHAPS